MNIRLYLRSLLIMMGLVTILGTGGGGDTPTPVEITTTSVPVVDITPDAFSFTDSQGVEPSTVITSDTTSITGITTPISISIQNGQYSINGNPFTNAAATVNNNDSVTLQHTASSDFDTATQTILKVGEMEQTFTSTTKSAPRAFKSSISNIELKSPTTGEPLLESTATFEGPDITAD